jgi:hypothetical protein
MKFSIAITTLASAMSISASPLSFLHKRQFGGVSFTLHFLSSLSMSHSSHALTYTNLSPPRSCYAQVPIQQALAPMRCISSTNAINSKRLSITTQARFPQMARSSTATRVQPIAPTAVGVLRGVHSAQ